MMKIAVAGIGYVGLSVAVLLAQHHEVTLVDVVPEKVNQINQKISPIRDREIIDYLRHKPLHLTATLDGDAAYRDAAVIFVATPTNYDPMLDCFDTQYVDAVISQILAVNRQAIIVIKSTIPVGYTQTLRKRYHTTKIIFSPEFLRESQALYDNLYPSRIIVGAPTDSASQKNAQLVASLLQEGALIPDVPTLIMPSTEAEAVKLFANTYLALRVAYFNELDTYAECNHLNPRTIIDGVCSDPRIGAYYNNPSFGYGGYCLPKDTQQLKANFANVPENLISAIINDNNARKDHITAQILQRCQQTGIEQTIIGIYRLTAKTAADNFRETAVHGIIQRLQSRGANIIIYEPLYYPTSYLGCPVCNDLAKFKREATLIVANRWDKNLTDVKDKVYTRDIFQRD